MSRLQVTDAEKMENVLLSLVLGGFGRREAMSSIGTLTEGRRRFRTIKGECSRDL
jgi:hypothetical protein